MDSDDSKHELIIMMAWSLRKGSVMLHELFNQAGKHMIDFRAISF